VSSITGTPFTEVSPGNYQEVSSAENPELANALAKQAFNAPTDAPPLPDTAGTLPHGYRTPNGELVKDFEIRELTGISEERLSKVLAIRNNNSTFPQVCRTIMEEGLVAIGGIAPNEHMMKTLLIGDRDYLLMKIRIATYGADYPARIICPKCAKEQDVIFELDEGQDINYRLAKATDPTYSVELRHSGMATVRLVNVDDQAFALRDVTLTAAERNTILLSRCIVSLNGNPMVNTEVAKALSAGNRKICLDFLNDNRFGPQTEEVHAHCDYCKEESEMALNLAALFL
jgi:hypothetical protein